MSGLGDTLAYETLLAAESPTFDWPAIDERSAASMCYTTGTTGDPKGVAYSHRSVYLHSFAVWATFRLDDNGRLLIIVPMFHVNAWGTPYAGWLVGSDLLLPGTIPAAAGALRLHHAGAADVHRWCADDPHRAAQPRAGQRW